MQCANGLKNMDFMDLNIKSVNHGLCNGFVLRIMVNLDFKLYKLSNYLMS